MNIWIYLIITIGSIIAISLTALYIVRSFLKNQLDVSRHKLRENARNALIPVKMQAYERLVILLERIRPTNLIMRIHHPGKNAKYLEKEIIKTIRSEFEHNLSQQLYISNDAWKMVSMAREQIILILSQAAKELEESTDGISFSQKVLDLHNSFEVSPIDKAILFLKREMMTFY